jgi:cytidylate kinase
MPISTSDPPVAASMSRPDPIAPLTIAIDGPAAAGKGTLAERLARHLGLNYLDTGLLYRAIGRIMADRGFDLDDADLAGAIAADLDPADLADPRLRGRESGELASRVAVHPGVRAALVAFQRAFAARAPGAVLDGRDIGTVILPDAAVKIFVTASPEVRARRRTDELRAKGRDVAYDTILAEIRARDARDSGRATAPLKAADDAAVLDTSGLDRDGAFAAALDIVERRRPA